MALIPPIPWVMGVPCVNHGLRTFELIPDIMRGVAGQPTHGIYPILRMPVYKTYAQHAANRTAINAEFAVCGCQGAIAAWARFNIAWATINGGPGPALIGGTKAFNDAFELGPANVPPVFAGLPGEPPLIHRTVGNWGPFFPPDTFDFVKSRTHQIWRKLNPISFYPKHMHNSFWHALSFAIWQDEKYWAQIKARVARYAQEILTPPWGPGVHPRAVDYQNLNAYALVRAAAVGAAAPMYPVAHLHNQLAPDGGLLGAVLGDRASSELWQIVADALRIELLVIIAQPLPTDPQKLIVPRGQHNAKQVFLYLEIDGEYRAAEPASRDPGSYRFEWFKDVEHNIPARTAAQALTWAVKIDLADEKRSPFTIVDTWERPIGVPPMPAGAAVPPAAILGAYAPPFVPPNPIVVDPISSVATDAQAFTYLNSGHWC
ncbi:uncharacterized protein PAC_12556 [Phialocephala subalpina]|uniref:Uncharacterized protein n=1 Tax=Phialocephala subalpina TaxID=576137 RepID=A0A1L7XCA2_9HELO|nr:uncharacterized protein PAC_12556 [Phialocephala subalpina]